MFGTRGHFGWSPGLLRLGLKVEVRIGFRLGLGSGRSLEWLGLEQVAG